MGAPPECGPQGERECGASGAAAWGQSRPIGARELRFGVEGFGSRVKGLGKPQFALLVGDEANRE